MLDPSRRSAGCPTTGLPVFNARAKQCVDDARVRTRVKLAGARPGDGSRDP